LHGSWNHQHDLDDAGFADMLLDILRGTEYTLVVIALVVLWVVPDPIGKMTEICDLSDENDLSNNELRSVPVVLPRGLLRSLMLNCRLTTP